MQMAQSPKQFKFATRSKSVNGASEDNINYAAKSTNAASGRVGVALTPNEDEIPIVLGSNPVHNAMNQVESADFNAQNAREVLHYLYRIGGDPAVESKFVSDLIERLEHFEDKLKNLNVRSSPNGKSLKLSTLRDHPFVNLLQSYLRGWGVHHDFERFVGQKHKVYFTIGELLRAYTKDVVKTCKFPDHRRDFIWDELDYHLNVETQPVIQPQISASPVSYCKPLKSNPGFMGISARAQDDLGNDHEEHQGHPQFFVNPLHNC